jgi:trehalose 6-phosphate phosphatase
MDTPSGRDTAPGSLAGHALFLDIDGTLLDLAPTPEAVDVPGWMVGVLERISGRLDGALAFVSGRTIASIDQLFRPLVLPAVGVHGGEIREPGGRLVVDERLSTTLQAAEPVLREAIAHLRGVHLENKQRAIALHYRTVPERGREVLKIAELVVAGMGGEFAVLMGKCVVEIRPRHLTKGTAIDHLMRELPFRGRIPIFAGDDCTDEDAFEVVNRLGGVSIHIGDSTGTRAKSRLSGPDQLRGWLQNVGMPDESSRK